MRQDVLKYIQVYKHERKTTRAAHMGSAKNHTDTDIAKPVLTTCWRNLHDIMFSDLVAVLSNVSSRTCLNCVLVQVCM